MNILTKLNKESVSNKWQNEKMDIQTFIFSLRGKYILTNATTVFRMGCRTLDELGMMMAKTKGNAIEEDYQASFAIYEELSQKNFAENDEFRTSFTLKKNSLYLAVLKIRDADLLSAGTSCGIELNLVNLLFPKMLYYELSIYKLISEVDE